MADLFYKISLTRREIISPIINKDILSLVPKAVPSDYLFGSNFTEQVKQVKVMEMQGRK